MSKLSEVLDKVNKLAVQGKIKSFFKWVAESVNVLKDVFQVHNASWVRHSFPWIWKQAIVVPVPKLISIWIRSYRPI